MRLIDADKLIEAINNPTTFEGQLEITLEDFVDLVKEQPTAYDVERLWKSWKEKKELLLNVWVKEMEQGLIK